MIAYHCTNNLKEILKDGIIKPNRLKNVYLFRDCEDAEFYKNEFGLSDIIECAIDSRQIESRWKASYGYVIKLKEGSCAKIRRSEVCQN
jgi:hypothetical protein